MKIKLSDLIKIIEDWAPKNFSEDFDNVGLIVGDKNSIINKAIITLDTSEDVIDEAVKNNCNLIITFHPIIFSGLKKITTETYIERVVLKALKNNINIYAIHTNLDNHPKGVNYIISKKLNLKNVSFLIPKKNFNIGMGMIGDLQNPVNEYDFLLNLSKKMNSGFLKHSDFLGKKIKILFGLMNQKHIKIILSKLEKILKDQLITLNPEMTSSLIVFAIMDTVGGQQHQIIC